MIAFQHCPSHMAMPPCYYKREILPFVSIIRILRRCGCRTDASRADPTSGHSHESHPSPKPDHLTAEAVFVLTSSSFNSIHILTSFNPHHKGLFLWIYNSTFRSFWEWEAHLELEQVPSIAIGREALCVMNPSMRPSLFDHLGTEFASRPTAQPVLRMELQHNPNSFVWQVMSLATFFWIISFVPRNTINVWNFWRRMFRSQISWRSNSKSFSSWIEARLMWRIWQRFQSRRFSRI